MKDHEAPGGKYANGVIVRQYRPGQVIRVTSHITANHAGFVDFKLCRNNNLLQDPTQDCFDLPEAALSVVEAGHVRFGESDVGIVTSCAVGSTPKNFFSLLWI